MKNILVCTFLVLSVTLFGQTGEKSSEEILTRNQSFNSIFNVMDFGAKGIGSKHDDTRAFQAAFKAAIKVRGKVVIPAPPAFYNITNTIEIVPAEGSQCYVTVEAHGHTSLQIHYAGPGQQPVFKILGLKSSIISGVKVLIEPGISNVQVWDIDTGLVEESTSHVTFINCISNLGDGINNVGFRLGHNSGGSNGDICHYLWQNCAVSGNKNIIEGQIGWLVEGHNTLANTWIGGSGAFLEKIYSNASQPNTNAKSQQGNSSVFFYGFGGSHNAIDFEISSGGTYLISGGRFEVGKRFLNVKIGSDHPAITMTAVQLSTYRPTDGCVFNMERPGTLIMDGCNLLNSDKSNFTSSMIKLGGFGKGQGSLIVRSGSYPAQQPFYTKLHPLWKINIQSVGRLSGVHSTTYFKDQLE